MKLTINNYKKTKIFTIKHVTFDLDTHNVIALIGPNGSGKTTIMNVLSLLERCETFSVASPEKTFYPFREKQQQAYLKSCLTLFDTNPFFDFLTTNEQFSMLTNINDNGSYDEKKYEVLCTYFDFDGYRNHLIKDLSMGNIKKMQIILTLSSDNRYIFMDEPTNGLDTTTKIKFSDLLNEEKKKGRRFLISSHQIDFISKVSDYYVFLDNGVVKDEGNKDYLKTKYDMQMNDDLYRKIYDLAQVT
jgi:ABC-type multidrug transport system ATPase subunit